MDQALDLDSAALALQRRRSAWLAYGWAAGALTWADGQYSEPWPYDPSKWLTTDRAAVRGDYSVGLEVTHQGQVGELIVYAGGWCDLRYWSGLDEEPVEEAPGHNAPLDLAALEAVIDRFESLFLDR